LGARTSRTKKRNFSQSPKRGGSISHPKLIPAKGRRVSQKEKTKSKALETNGCEHPGKLEPKGTSTRAEQKRIVVRNEQKWSGVDSIMVNDEDPKV